MPPSNRLAIHPGLPADIPAFIDIYWTGFKDALSQTAFPRSSPEIRQWWIANSTKELLSATSTKFLKVVETAESGEETIIAWAKWETPFTNQKGEVEVGGDKPDDMPTWPPGADKELCDEFFGALAVTRDKLLRSRPHYCSLPSSSLPA